MYEFEKEKYTDKQRKDFANSLKDLAEQSSKNELIAIDCEREVNAMKFAEYMTKHIGEEFQGFVNGVNSFGIFVELPNTIEGMIRLSNLKNDFYVYDQENNQFIGRSFKHVITLGTKLLVRVIAADKKTRKIDFELVKFI